ncbi:hypothetical protein ERO13_D12G098650v2 [Gossypium hirsutum]|uniref:Uncharacterized protein n=1 Tax=Gossypium darwinii TaxID=34276 RepID=A0A5D2AAG0_GOSDA|nr:hypothetical protein ERO13_D12G098650v2 [Gossypium hirsutum]TYG40715.1 hypothetical protein ES288_D12G115500v1 [Gossypium darwinii]
MLMEDGKVIVHHAQPNLIRSFCSMNLAFDSRSGQSQGIKY